MRTEEFDYHLPEELIALRPLRPRRAARLLVAQGDAIADSHVRDLGAWLRPGDLLVFNDTKVIPARLRGVRRRAGGGEVAVEATLLAPGEGGRWRALARPGRRLAPGDRIEFGAGLVGEVMAREGAEIELAFALSGRAFDRALARAGEMPLPPYIASRRAAEPGDRRAYQTVFAARPGAVAAPTAALHFDRVLLADLEARGIRSVRVTLHVGAGTFLPVTAEEIEGHRMHSERGEIGEAATAAIRETMAAGGRVIPVGTTALRVLETAATGPRQIAPWAGETEIFIRPGYAFRVADGLMTNFHLPRSTLMMLVSALMGVERIRRIYAHAIAGRYRFFSYGDASLLLPHG
ncbi:MAG TPA: tRNA preQ1(34) S-adenosylmethionine ribosyltransferase-isomerase QueA [Amaricoccus sp.]|uniref:tRNA preQ1(34) S-adenosylmethionine ribosyltransferase-isomerase QueA n=1 Tax=Amaricoccus sp. TaxID=1872485 RepID=UPI002CA80A1C|nr:tRNA preQ1(34) S-adenosylmethionine ribosyltransferase-isomerase QueA [Amaricoccus sp.]HMQ93608.1 tRNA preQ1(34) S-adenosylmethionine ribosyltransferase-isomerase QueA [Amaricoccus sp.]HMR52975.1 tRNA preQ1(34) S-adenosylmethionine ribosyltransferase-isomerase QueA [Amaricoccus sp.]HMR59868.1 tRNA preQ1(34) S-adenosylmethionine ribosyltransferase-isomerase QueA [Amaricoccus sp.]HMT99880.1 tRNA preQ1(34) S-adenosylmethionine ribosyltransferase-isomerase QueA [Amaricoccus sp.]